MLRAALRPLAVCNGKVAGKVWAWPVVVNDEFRFGRCSRNDQVFFGEHKLATRTENRQCIPVNVAIVASGAEAAEERPRIDPR